MQCMRVAGMLRTEATRWDDCTAQTLWLSASNVTAAAFFARNAPTAARAQCDFALSIYSEYSARRLTTWLNLHSIVADVYARNHSQNEKQ